MRRVFPSILAITLAVVSRLHGEEAAGAQELHELKQAVQQQSRQIEILIEQVGKLTRAVEGQKSTEPTVRTTESSGAAAPTTSIESAKPPAESAAEAPKPESVPKAEAVPGGKHAVAKGETLTSIAKHYNISIADLKNANKIDNERKLQIGQILSIPTSKNTETTDKKENP